MVSIVCKNTNISKSNEGLPVGHIYVKSRLYDAVF